MRCPVTVLQLDRSRFSVAVTSSPEAVTTRTLLIE
jgi:hypothetical protein